MSQRVGLGRFVSQSTQTLSRAIEKGPILPAEVLDPLEAVLTAFEFRNRTDIGRMSQHDCDHAIAEIEVAAGLRDAMPVDPSRQVYAPYREKRVSSVRWRGLPGDPKAFVPGNAPAVSGKVVTPRDGVTGGLRDLHREIKLDREELRHNLTVWYRGLNEAQKRRVRRFIGVRKAFK